ncbi:MAG: hypothetical protein RL380_601, partial [Verrucomicrobiota bacterium]
PAPITLAATGVSNTIATLNATVAPNGRGARAWFEWGPGARWLYEAPAIMPGTPDPTGELPLQFFGLPVSANLTGLVPGVTYHARIVVSNEWGVVRGREIIFGSPAIRLSGGARVTLDCNAAYNERGAEILAAPIALAAGGYHTVARKQDGTAFAWGYDVYGQTDVPWAVADVVGVGAAATRSAAVRADGRVLVWGNNSGGLTNVPVSISNCTAVALGSAHALVLRVDGSLAGWGNNGFGQLKFPADNSGFTALAAGNYHNVALRTNGSVTAWGRNSSGQTNVPVAATNGVAVAAGFNHSLALRADRTVVAWGENTYGQATVPSNLTDVVAIAAGGYHSLALRNDGTVVRWGYASGGLAPIPASVTNVISLAAGSYFDLAVRGDGSLVGWGQHNFGQTDVLPELARLNLPVTVSGAVNSAVPGSYELNYSVTNALGGVGSATRTVMVACAARTAAHVDVRARTEKAPAGFSLGFTNEPGKSFTVLGSSDLAQPVTEWVEVGVATEIAPGEYQFTVEAAADAPPRFYRVRSP